MNYFSRILLGLSLVVISLNGLAQDCSGFYYITSNTGWTNSEYYQIIDIDAAKLTSTSLPAFTASDGSINAVDTDFGSGTFLTPVLTTTDGLEYTPTGKEWLVRYYLAAFAPTKYTSAYSKLTLYGMNPSGTGTYAACTFNDNSVMNSKIFDKPGFIELSRMGSAVLKTPPSRHGYIQLDSLPQVERIQWSYSSTSWKRGVKADINYNDGLGWQPLRWVASDYSSWEATFSEQGYQFEEVIGKHEDPNSFISLRFRIWDGDSIHYKVNANDLSLQESTYSATMTPYDQRQTVRIHQIKVFSGIIPDQVPNAVGIPVADFITISRQYNQLVLSESARLSIYSIDGKVVLDKLGDKADISNLPKGIYILKAQNEKGKILQKIII